MRQKHQKNCSICSRPRPHIARSDLMVHPRKSSSPRVRFTVLIRFGFQIVFLVSCSDLTRAHAHHLKYCPSQEHSARRRPTRKELLCVLINVGSAGLHVAGCHFFHIGVFGRSRKARAALQPGAVCARWEGTNPSRYSAGAKWSQARSCSSGPGIEHAVVCSSSINVIYLTAAMVRRRLSGGAARRWTGESRDRRHFPRIRCSDGVEAAAVSSATQFPPQLVPVIGDLIAEPMSRMTQRELSRQTAGGKDGALRMFRAATGQTFRGFERWSGLQRASPEDRFRRLVGTTTIDEGLPDSHLSRTFRTSFGLFTVRGDRGLAKASPK